MSKYSQPLFFVPALVRTVLVGTALVSGVFAQSAKGNGVAAYAQISGLPPSDTTAGEGVVIRPETPTMVDPHLVSKAGASQVDTSASTSPVLHRKFAGHGDGNAYPKDPTIATGPNHIVTAVNASIRIQTRTGNVLRTTTAKTMYAPLGNSALLRFYEPWAVFDVFSKRFMLHFSARPKTTPIGAKGYSFLAVSKSDDPTKGWWLIRTEMSINGGANNGCYPTKAQISATNGAIFIVCNMFRFLDDKFAYTKIRVLQNKGDLISGTKTLKSWDLWNIKYFGSVLKARDVVACKMNTTILGKPAYFCATINGTGSNVHVWALTKTANTTTGPVLHSTRVPVSTYKTARHLPQKGSFYSVPHSSPKLVNAAYRGRSIFTAHSVEKVVGIDKYAAIRWYELAVGSWPGAGAVSVKQESTYHQPLRNYALPTVAVNGSGDLAIVFANGVYNEHLQLRVTTRRSVDPLHKLHESVPLVDGSSAYSHPVNNVNQFSSHFGCDNGPDGEIFFVGEYPTSGNKSETFIGSTFPGPVVAPAGYALNEGELSSTLFSRRSMRTQLMDTGFSGKGARAISGVAFRLDYRSHTPSTAMGREWSSTRVRMAETARYAMSKKFVDNYKWNYAQVFSGKLNMGSQIGSPASKPAAFDRMVIPFNQQWVFGGAADRSLVLDLKLEGGTLNNGGSWIGSKPYYLDAPRQIFMNQGAVRPIGDACKDSNMTVNSFCYPFIFTYAKETGDVATQGQVEASLHGYTKKGGTAMYAFGLKEHPGGVVVPDAVCNRLWMDPQFVFPVNPSPKNGFFELKLGALPFQAGFVGAKVYSQAGWADSTTGFLRLSRAGEATIKGQPSETPTLFSTTANDANLAEGSVPSAAGSANPVRRYFQ